MSVLFLMQPLMPGTWWILSAYSLAHWDLLFWQLFRGLIPAYVPYANKYIFFQLLHLVQSIRVCCHVCVPTTSFSLCIGQYLLALKCSYPNLLQQGWTIMSSRKTSHTAGPQEQVSWEKDHFYAAFPLCLLQLCRGLWPEWGSLRF